jgi:steroid delta-isomerase-like uncharacterized protein
MMSVQDNKMAARRFVDEVVGQGNLDVIDELVAEDFVEHQEFPGLPTRGPEAVRANIGLFLAAFSDLDITVEDVIAEGDAVVMRQTMRGTHTGEFMGIPATGKSFEIQAIDIVRMRDGKATEHWGLTDDTAMMQQLGMMPEE